MEAGRAEDGALLSVFLPLLLPAGGAAVDHETAGLTVGPRAGADTAPAVAADTEPAEL